MKKLILFATTLVLLATTGCSQFSLVNSETYNNANLAQYHTFRIVTPADGHMIPGMQMVTYYNIAAAIREQMIERGFVEDSTSNLLVNIALTVKNEIATEPVIPPGYMPYAGPMYNGLYPFYMYPYGYWNNYYASYYSNAQVITGIYKEGVLTMDMVNIKDQLPLYSASVATILNQGSGQFRNLNEISQAVSTLFSKFPVPLLPQYKNK